MWLRTDSFAFRGLSASNFNCSLEGQLSRFGFGKSSAKCFRPSSRSVSSERGFFLCFRGLLLASGKAKALLNVLTVALAAVIAPALRLGYTVFPRRESQFRIRLQSLSTKSLRDD